MEWPKTARKPVLVVCRQKRTEKCPGYAWRAAGWPLRCVLKGQDRAERTGTIGKGNVPGPLRRQVQLRARGECRPVRQPARAGLRTLGAFRGDCFGRRR